MKVEWTLPSDHGTPITEFKVFVNVLDSDTYTQESIDCVGSD
jgi:hypothetical protein